MVERPQLLGTEMRSPEPSPASSVPHWWKRVSASQAQGSRVSLMSVSSLEYLSVFLFSSSPLEKSSRMHVGLSWMLEIRLHLSGYK